MNGLLVSWVESLKFFLPQNMLVFLSEIAKTIVRTYKVWLKYFGWLLVLNFVLQPLLEFLPVLGVAWQVSLWISILTQILLVFTLYLSVRPSAEPKTFSYFLSYWRYCAGYVVFYFVASFGLKHFKDLVYSLQLPDIISYAYTHVINLIFIIHPMRGQFDMTRFLHTSPFFIFATLFYLDSRGGVRDLIWSVWRGIKMLMYNLPFCYLTYWILGYAFLGLLSEVVSIPFDELLLRYFVGSPRLFIHLREALRESLGILLFPLFLCLFSTFYAMRAQEQPHLYYDVKEEV